MDGGIDIEPNQPNTLNSCTDGNKGFYHYHYDESVDKTHGTEEEKIE